MFICVFAKLIRSGRLVQLTMHDNGHLKLVRPIVAIASGFVFARARLDLVNNSRMKVLAVHAYRCHWASITDGCTADFQHAVSDIRKAAAKPKPKPKPKPKQNATQNAAQSEPAESVDHDPDKARNSCV